MKKKLLLFDVDETLVSFKGISLSLRVKAIEKVLDMDGLRDAKVVPYGKTDPQIIKEIMEGNEIPQDVIFSHLEEICDHFALYMIENLDKAKEARVYPGVESLLKRLAAYEDVILGLLTGNLRPLAEAKLKRFDLWHFFKVGAYGSDDMDRTKLPQLAMNRAREALSLKEGDLEAIIIGDSPLDIECAKKTHSQVIAVATGVYSLEELAKHRPDLLLKDLTHEEQFLQFLAQN